MIIEALNELISDREDYEKSHQMLPGYNLAGRAKEQLAALKAENEELTRKGMQLCEQNGDLLMQNAALRKEYNDLEMLAEHRREDYEDDEKEIEALSKVVEGARWWRHNWKEGDTVNAVLMKAVDEWERMQK